MSNYRHMNRKQMIETLNAEEHDIEIGIAYAMGSVPRGWTQDRSLLPNLSPETMEYFSMPEQMDESDFIDSDRRITVRMVLPFNPLK